MTEEDTTSTSAASSSASTGEAVDISASGRATILTFGVVALNSVGNLAFHALVARHDGTSGYGAVAALLSFGTVSGVLASGIQFAVARRTAQPRADVHHELGRGIKALVPWMGLSLVLALCSAPLASYLHLTGTTAVVFAAVYFASNIVQAVPLGVLIGLRRFMTWAVVVVLAVVARLILVVAMGSLGDTETGALISSGAACAISAAIGVLLIWAPWRARPPKVAPEVSEPENAPVDRVTGGSGAALADDQRAGDVEGPAAEEDDDQEEGIRTLALEGIGGALLGAGLWTVWVLPVVFGRHFLSGQESGRFASSQLLATGIIYLVGAVTTAFFPSVARHRSAHAVARGALLALAVTMACVAGFVLLGPPVVRKVYGPNFVVSRELMLAFGISVGVVAMSTFFLWISRALRHVTVLPAVGIVTAVVTEVILGTTWNSGSLALASGPTISFVVGGLAAGLAGLVVGGSTRSARHAPGAARHRSREVSPASPTVVDADAGLALERQIDEEVFAEEHLLEEGTPEAGATGDRAPR